MNVVTPNYFTSYAIHTFLNQYGQMVLRWGFSQPNKLTRQKKTGLCLLKSFEMGLLIYSQMDLSNTF